jgi:hypothetical protein
VQAWTSNGFGVLRLDRPLVYNHSAIIEYQTEVALLTRRIVFQVSSGHGNSTATFICICAHMCNTRSSRITGCCERFRSIRCPSDVRESIVSTNWLYQHVWPLRGPIFDGLRCTHHDARCRRCWADLRRGVNSCRANKCTGSLPTSLAFCGERRVEFIRTGEWWRPSWHCDAETDNLALFVCCFPWKPIYNLCRTRRSGTAIIVVFQCMLQTVYVCPVMLHTTSQDIAIILKMVSRQEM